MLRFRNFVKENSIVGTYEVTTTTSDTRVYGSRFTSAQICKMYVDGVELTKTSSTYKFSTTGSHTVKLVFKSSLYSCANLFDGCSTLTNVDMTNFSTKYCDNMYRMFADCVKLQFIDTTQLNTSSTTTTEAMFYNCQSLISLDLSKFNTNKVICMNQMFSNCQSLSSLDLSSFDTSNVTNMTSMFDDCNSLVSLKMMGNVNKVTTYSNIFRFINTNGTLYYNAAYDYSKLIAQLPTTWEAIAVEV